MWSTRRATSPRSRSAGADNMARLGQAYGAADQLGKELPQAAGFIHSAADTLQGAASSMRERTSRTWSRASATSRRRQPAAAFAGSVLAGFALARFLKSSGPRALDGKVDHGRITFKPFDPRHPVGPALPVHHAGAQGKPAARTEMSEKVGQAAAGLVSSSSARCC